MPFLTGLLPVQPLTGGSNSYPEPREHSKLDLLAFPPALVGPAKPQLPLQVEKHCVPALQGDCHLERPSTSPPLPILLPLRPAKHRGELHPADSAGYDPGPLDQFLVSILPVPPRQCLSFSSVNQPPGYCADDMGYHCESAMFSSQHWHDFLHCALFWSFSVQDRQTGRGSQPHRQNPPAEAGRVH